MFSEKFFSPWNPIVLFKILPSVVIPYLTDSILTTFYPQQSIIRWSFFLTPNISGVETPPLSHFYIYEFPTYISNSPITFVNCLFFYWNCFFQRTYNYLPFCCLDCINEVYYKLTNFFPELQFETVFFSAGLPCADLTSRHLFPHFITICNDLCIKINIKHTSPLL